ncbi:nuclear pore complex protein Nup98-Nup96 [Drosophila montana]|uniref:nuclear pore complex protein Nup98-Nup96 n=1 Tax=Drosophila montana TaxID=40370 RepID=UPI00313DC8CB
MFGGAKPTFGAGAGTTGFGTFSNSAAATPFGQSAFGKPATPAFGGTPAFGAQPTQPSMFGSATATSQPTGGLFGGAGTTSAFGGTTTAPTSFGAFSQPQQTSNIFGSTQAAPNTSLFGQAATSAFGAAKPATMGMSSFGQTPAAQPLFGQQATASSTTGFGSFGQAAPTTTNVFGSGAASAFGQPQSVAVGAAGGVNPGTSLVKYQPTIGTDTLMKGGQPNNVNTKQHCITAMKEYEMKSLEELRMEDYLSSRKGPQAGSAPGAFGFGSPATGTQPAAGGLFGSPAQQQPGTGLFGQAGQENKSLFGSSAFGQPAATSAFGAPAQQNNFMQKPFGAAPTSAFGTTTADASNPFGAKPVGFGQGGGSMFSQAAATSAAPAFGQTTSGFGGFGSTAGTTNQQTPLFGQTNATDPNKPAFGLGANVSAANTGFGGFGAPATSTAGGGLFGSKPATSFATPAFGASSTANTGFGNFSLSNTNAGTGGGLFNSNLNKPATSAFGGFGGTSSAPLNFNAGNTGGSIFSNAAKPGGLFGGTSTLGTGTGTTVGGGGLFGTSGAGGAFGSSLGGGFGNLGGGNMALSGMGGLGAAPAQGVVMVPIHQQILSKVTSPYGDTPIFKDLKRSDDVDATRATNPAAQQAVLDMNSNQFKITNKESPASIRVKALSNSKNRKSMFEGLEEFDASVEGFNLKPNVKRLVIKPKVKTTPNQGEASSMAMSNNNSNSPIVGVVRPQRESFNNVIPNEPLPSGSANSSPAMNKADQDSSRRESWLHPNNLAKVRQHNLQTGMDQAPLNSTLTELVPRKPLETYKSTLPTRLSVSTIPENPFEDQSSSIARRDTFTSEHGNESTLSIRSHDSEQRLAIEAPAEADANADADTEPHPTGIVLRRVGYYTIPPLDDLKSYLAEDGSCVVPNFTVGREGYGNVYFGKELDVAGLNLDEIVHFRNKEVIIYPDDDNKPPIGSGLNREAQVTLDQVWPVDKTKHEAIKDPQRLIEIDWEGKLRRVCDKNATRFIEYRPETGSWVFRVKHFSKYGLNDSDEEDEEMPTDPKKAKMVAMDAHRAAATDKMTLTSLRKAQKISEDAARSMDPKSLAAGVASGFRPMDNSAEFLMMDKTQFFQAGSGTDFSMFDAPRTVTSPTAALAQEVVGKEPHKMQLMKSSLFVEDQGSDDEMDTQPIHSRPQVKRAQNLFSQDTNLWKDAAASETSSDYGRQSPLLAVSSSASVTSIIRELQSEEASSLAAESIVPAEMKAPAASLGGLKPFNFVIKPKVAPIKVFATTVPLTRSITKGLHEHWIADLGFYKGRSFKLSFGPQNTLMVPNTYNNLRSVHELSARALPAALVFEPRASNDFSPNLLQRVKFNTVDMYADFAESIVPHLQVQLQGCSSNQVEGSDCPWLQSSNGTQLIAKHLAEAIKLNNTSSMASYGVSVWSLLFTLWGEHEELIGQDASSHYVVMCRRNLLSEWLENTLVSKDLLSKKVSSNSYLAHMLELLSCHRVTEACELAFKYDDANLALILAQLSSGAVVRLLLEEQLFAWQQSKSDKYISLERIKMFMMAAGVPLMQSSHGPINLLEDGSWLTVLALQLWYFTAPTSTITDAMLEYDKAFQADELYAEEPRPSYKGAPYTSKTSVYDLRYHLLQLYSKRKHSLEQTLNPITHTSDPMDFRLSWMLLQTLEALGYCHCSSLAEAQLHVDFASQLENEGLWQWAIFVQLHIKDRNQRERAVQHTLQQHVSIDADVPLNEEEQFIIEQLGVPESWVDYAKALKAGALDQRHLQAKYLLKAKHWVLAHEVIYQYIAPDAVINSKLQYLYNLLSQFECTDGSNVKVPNWTNQGQIFLDYIDINEKFRHIHNVSSVEDIHARWENLKPQLSEICSRISLLPCPTSKHRLCQSEIAKSLSCLVNGMCIVCPELEPCVVLKMALERLPMPQEFSTKELSNLLDELMHKIQNQRPFTDSESAPLHTTERIMMQT